MKNEIIERLNKQYNSFTKSFKKITDFIKFNQNTIAYISINDLAEATGTSPATITRFSKSLGYKGYPAFQEVFQKNLDSEASHMKNIQTAISDMNTLDENIVQKIIDDNIQLLNEMNYSLLEAKIETAIDWLDKNKKIYILGARGSYALAHYLYFLLRELREDVDIMISGASDFTDKLLYSKPDDILLCISFHPYSNFTFEIAKYFKDNGNKIITITDKKDSKLGALSDLVITAKNSGMAYTFVPAIVIINGIIMKLANKNKDAVMKNLEKLNKINQIFDVYSDN